MKKYGVYILFIIGVVLVFCPFKMSFSEVYFKIIGISFCMFSLYLISSKLNSKEPHDNQNLKF